MKSKLLLVFGVSGVGKTTMCSAYANETPGAVHFSASSLLNLERSSAQRRTVVEAARDQHSLLKSITKLRESDDDNLILIDAHSVIVVDQQLFKVPSDVIGEMQPNGLVFIRAEPDVIIGRRSLRGDIGGSDQSSEKIEKMQLMALQAVEEYALALSLPLSIVSAGQSEEFAVIVDKFL